MKTGIVLLCIYDYFIITTEGKSKIRKFPANFWFGASTSAYQIEGAWNEDGKVPSIWDIAVHQTPSPIRDGSTGDVAADSYHLYNKDVNICQDLKLNFYKFSVAWTRILPNGFADKVNLAGVDYYRNLIDSLLAAKIQPFLTIYSGDLPYSLQKLGGWANSMIVDWFADYAKVLFEKFGDKVKHWVTINDPKEVCVGGYGSTVKAPMLNLSGIAEYMCAKNLLLGHAKVYHIFDEKYRKRNGGIIGISITFTWYDPASEAHDDHQAAADARMFEWGLYAHPIFSKTGDFPVEVKRNIAVKSAEQGFPRSRLPDLTVADVVYIKGTADFLGVNTYTIKLAYRDASLEGMYAVPSFKDDLGAVLVKDPSWTHSANSWLQEAPWGFHKLLKEIKTLYNNPSIYITGNGWATKGGLLDEDRISYMKTYLYAVLDALDEGSDIRGYSVWSLIDTFEWNKGYTEAYGLYEVDFGSADKTRTPRKSAFVYKEIVRSLTLDPDYEPEKFLVEAPDTKYESEDTRDVF